MLTLFENKLCFNNKLYGPPGFSNFLRSLKTMIGFKILPFSSYDFFNKDKVLGVKKKESLDRIMLERKLFGLDLLQEFKGKEKEEINDAEDYIRESSFYEDENLSITPVLLARSNARKIDMEEVYLFTYKKDLVKKERDAKSF